MGVGTTAARIRTGL